MLAAIMNRIQTWERGQSLAEYALILALIAVVAIVALTLLGGNIATMLNTVSAEL